MPREPAPVISTGWGAAQCGGPHSWGCWYWEPGFPNPRLPSFSPSSLPPVFTPSVQSLDLKVPECFLPQAEQIGKHTVLPCTGDCPPHLIHPTLRMAWPETLGKVGAELSSLGQPRDRGWGGRAVGDVLAATERGI